MTRHPQFDCDIPAPCASCAAANARIAELEGLTEVIEGQAQLRAALTAANARAEAAEREAAEFKDMYEAEKLSVHQVCDRAETAESEAADLRAELAEVRSIAAEVVEERKALRAEVTQANLDKSAAYGELNMALHASEHWSKEAAHHRDESEALRAEVERLRECPEMAGYTWAKASRVTDLEREVQLLTRALHHHQGAAEALRAEVERLDSAGQGFVRELRASESRLAAANALLVETAEHCPDRLRHRVHAHLAAQPATAPAECRCDLGAVNCPLHRLGAPAPGLSAPAAKLDIE